MCNSHAAPVVCFFPTDWISQNLYIITSLDYKMQKYSITVDNVGQKLTQSQHITDNAGMSKHTLHTFSVTCKNAKNAFYVKIISVCTISLTNITTVIFLYKYGLVKLHFGTQPIWISSHTLNTKLISHSDHRLLRFGVYNKIWEPQTLVESSWFHHESPVCDQTDDCTLLHILIITQKTTKHTYWIGFLCEWHSKIISSHLSGWHNKLHSVANMLCSAIADTGT